VDHNNLFASPNSPHATPAVMVIHVRFKILASRRTQAMAGH
jgi:hypothetical protein